MQVFSVSLYGDSNAGGTGLEESLKRYSRNLIELFRDVLQTL